MVPVLNLGPALTIMESTNSQVTRLDQLQDIDELYVVEGPPPTAAGGAGNGYLSQQQQQQQQQRPAAHLVGVADTEISAEQSGRLEEDANHDNK